jgi:phage terminase large subunit GpA-like protein
VIDCADGFAVTLQAAANALLPDPPLHLDRWSEDHVVIPKGGAFEGPYRLSHTPYARRVLQVLSPDHPCKRVVVMAASQMLKTQVAINAMLGWIDLAPANILALEPNTALAKRLGSRLDKSIAACAAVRGKVAKPRSRDAKNTWDTKEFDGGTAYIATAGSDTNLAEIPARYVFIDEVDRVNETVGSEGDKVDIAEARATTYEGISNFYEVSSPTSAATSKIAALHAMGTQEVYQVPCPHCGHLHELVQDNFRYDYDPDADRVHRAWFVCPDCGCEIDEHHKSTMLPDVAMGGQARWVARSEGDGETISFQISAFYAPLGSINWLSLARQHARAETRRRLGDKEAIKVYRNTRLGLTHDNTESTTTVDKLKALATLYPMRVVPAQALVLTMAVDTQDDRLEVQIEAWGPGLQHWLVDYIVLNGSPAVHPVTPGSVWQRLDAIRRTPLPHASFGQPIMISAYGIDTGGSHTQDVYNYVAAREHLNCLALKGANRPNKPIISQIPSKVDIEWGGTKRENGVALWMVGTDVAKDWLHNRVRIVDGPGAMHTPVGLPDTWYEGFLAERKEVSYRRGRVFVEWKCPQGARNEPLDLSVYNLSVAHSLGLHKWSAADWDRLRKRLVPEAATPDLFAQAPELAAPEAEPAPPEPVMPEGASTEQPTAATPAPAPNPPPAYQPAPDHQFMAAPARRRVINRGLQ